MADNKLTYEEWVKDAKSKLPQELQADFDKITGHEAGKVLFNGHLTEREFYRRLNALSEKEKELSTKEQQWTEWFREEAPKNERLVAEREALQAQLDRLKTAAGLAVEDKANTSPANTMGEDVKKEIETLKQQLQFVDQALPRLFKDYGEVTYRVINEKWPVKPGEVLDYALTKHVDMNSAFEQLTAEERGKRATAERDQLIKDAEERGRREALKRAGTPDNLRPNGPSVIDTLRNSTTPTTPHGRVNAAVDAWIEQVNSGKAPNGIFE